MWDDDVSFEKKRLSSNKLSKCVYVGQLDSVSKQPHGIGRICWKNNAVFEGLFVDGARTGFGRMIFANGSYYEGYFKDGAFDGEGM